MNNGEWFKYYDENKLSFKWFILQYFQADIWLGLEKDRKDENRAGMTTTMNLIWYQLPDHRFNIINNPLGWSEFLHLVEE